MAAALGAGEDGLTADGHDASTQTEADAAAKAGINFSENNNETILQQQYLQIS